MIFKTILAFIAFVCFVKSTLDLKEVIIWYKNKVTGVFFLDVVFAFWVVVLTFLAFILFLLIALGVIGIKG